MILTVMSYLLSRRTDLIGQMQDMLKNNSEYFANAEVIVQARLSLFLGYYCDNVFKSDASHD
jgi:hypothetical protein